MWPNPQETAYSVTFTEEILNGKLHFLCSVNSSLQGSSNFLHLLRVLQVFLQESFTNSWKAFEASSNVVFMGVVRGTLILPILIYSTEILEAFFHGHYTIVSYDETFKYIKNSLLTTVIYLYISNVKNNAVSISGKIFKVL